jgi:anion exchange protein
MRKIPEGAETTNILVGEVDFVEQQMVCFVRLANSVILGDITEVPVPTRFVFILLGPKGYISKYREIGRSIATLMTDELFDDIVYSARTREDILSGLDKFLDQVTVLPPGEWNPNIRLDPPQDLIPKEKRLNGSGGDNSNEHLLVSHLENDPTLRLTGKFCGGLIDDIKRKAPWFLSDFKDGLNLKCLSSVLFMYFACLSPIITFGGLLGDATDSNMAAIESLVSGAVCGISYHLFGGQPMTIIGSTGPILVFETILNKFCKANGIDYMGFRAWVGLWLCFILIILVLTDLSFLVKYITRFTEECFAILIAFIFIKEAFLKLFAIRKLNNFSSNSSAYMSLVNNESCWECRHKKGFELLNDSMENMSNFAYDLSSLAEAECRALGVEYEYIKKCTYIPDVFLFSCVLFMLTFLLAMALRSVRTSPFFPASIRSKISDFGVVITIATVVGLDYLVGLDTPKLQVPDKFETTVPERGWFINPIERNKDKLWVVFPAIIPALLATILIFMDQHITSVIVNRRENKLKKSCGYHLDLLIIAICIGICSLFGLPWFVAATVLSINHVISLKKESESAAPGEKPQFLGVIEQRVTGLAIFILIGCSILMTKVLRFIPMPVLYGVFLYMGISSVDGIQFVQRMLIFFMPEKYQPDYGFLRHVRTFKVHLFTFIQLFCLAMLFVIKMNAAISILFPLMVTKNVFLILKINSSAS